ncbi:MAG: hypothetical protein ABC585_06175 [Candidatus Methanosuratincola petrocarbonis]
MKKYFVKLKELFEDDRTSIYARVTELSVNGKSVDRLVKVSNQSIDFRSDISIKPINEVILPLQFSFIKEMDEDNDKRDQFIKSVLSKTRTGKINIPFIMLGYQKLPTAAEMNQALTFLVDIIYNNEKIDLLVPPKVILPESIMERTPDSYQKHLDALFEIMQTYSRNLRPACFIPAYLPRSKIPKIIESYATRFGPEVLLILDVAGNRFEGGAYSIVSQVMFNIDKIAKTEDYAIYLFNHKSRKRSGKEVPSEDLLSLLRGVSFVGPSHVPLKLPKNVVSGLGKVFNNSDFLYYPEDTAPNMLELHKFSRGALNATSLNKFNDFKVNMCAIELSKDPVAKVSEIKKPEFKETLLKVSKQMIKFKEQKVIEDFL